MPDLITKEELVRIAERWGRENPGRYIEQLIEEGLIPPAKPNGRGHREGVDWFYPDGTDIAVRAVLRLRKMNIRGNALHFCMWWLSLIKHSAKVSEYVASIFAFTPMLIGKRSATVLERIFRSQIPDSRDQTEVDITKTDVIQSELRRVFKPKILTAIGNLLKPIDSTFAQLSKEELEEVVTMFSAASLDLHPDEFELPIRELGEYLTMDLQGRAPISRDVIEKAFADFRAPGGFDRFVENIRTASAEIFQQARVNTRESREIMNFNRGISRWSSRISSLLSNRYKTRLGPWKLPSITVKAMSVGYMVWYFVIIEQSLYNIGEEEQHLE